ncbi:MAG: pyridoxamine 5'-phosphate oxidase [Myxococcota bacterium]
MTIDFGEAGPRLTAAADEPRDPMARLEALWALAQQHEAEPAAMTLATVDHESRPAARIVLLRALSERGLVFFTNYRSAKGRQLHENPYAAACIYWRNMKVQIRVNGQVSMLDTEQSDAYFAGRPTQSQLGAWASEQSSFLGHRDELMGRVDERRRRYGEASVPRPAHWGGYLIAPEQVEFWFDGEGRLHHRVLYQRQMTEWRVRLLQP